MNEQTSWDFTRIFKTKEDYDKCFSQVENSFKELSKFQGNLNNKENVLNFLKQEESSEELFAKLFTYSSMHFDQNQKDPSNQVLRGKVMDLYGKYIQATSFSNSEIIANGTENLESWSKEKEFKPYSYVLKRLIKNQNHILSAKEESIIANYANVTNSLTDLYDMAAVADSKDNKVTFSTGETTTINHANYGFYLQSLTSQDDRRIAFETMFKPFDDLKNTFAGIYSGIVQSNIAQMKNRGYSSILSSFLDDNDIPESVYLSLLNTVHKRSQVVKDYYKLKKDFLDLETFHTYDRFVKLAKSDIKYTYEQGKEVFWEACNNIGGDFVKKAHEVLEPGRVDVYHQDGKRSGAYSTGFYDLGPYILLNYNDTFSDVFTLAHEAGHSIHTMLANENNTYFNSNYTIFVAEIASTFNEQMLQDYFMSKDIDHNTKLFLLQSAADDLIGTFYRQALFADYEYQAHNLALNGTPLTAEALEKLMTDLYQEYYGIDLNNEPYKNNVWAYIPHLFHSPFYVYQYATCLACSIAIYSKVKNHEPNALENYFNMLKAGGSDFPMNIVALGGVDLTSSEPFEAVFDRLEYLISEIKKELKK